MTRCKGGGYQPTEGSPPMWPPPEVESHVRKVPLFPPMKMGEPIEITPEMRVVIDEYLEDLKAWVSRRDRKGACPVCGREEEDG